jgi:hypothetical protein
MINLSARLLVAESYLAGIPALGFAISASLVEKALKESTTVSAYNSAIAHIARAVTDANPPVMKASLARHALYSATLVALMLDVASSAPSPAALV